MQIKKLQIAPEHQICRASAYTRTQKKKKKSPDVCMYPKRNKTSKSL